MIIKVSVDSIDMETYQKIIDHYNANKPTSEEPLERLGRAEGGFQIKIPGRQDDRFDSNQKIRQLRWSRKQLVSGVYIGFTPKQENLLHNALIEVLGQSNVSVNQT
jgi:hypothetical protein